MKLFFRSLPRLFHNANKDMSRHFSMTFSSVLSVAIALLLSMAMLLITLNVSRMSTNVESQLELQVALSPGLDEEKREALQESIESLDEVGSVRFSDRDQELETLIEENGQMFSQYRDSNPLYDVFIVEVSPIDSLHEASEEISAMNGVVEVSYGGQSILNMVSMFDSVRHLGVLITAFLMLLGIFLIRNTVAMTMASRNDEISIMRTVGAYNFYIQTPFILEGLAIGFYGALIPIVLISAGYSWLYYAFDGALVTEIFSLVSPWPMLLQVDLGILAAGLALGALGAWLAVGKTLRKVR